MVFSEWTTEVKVWERIDACYIEFKNKHTLEKDQLKILIGLLIQSSLDGDLDNYVKKVSNMPDELQSDLTKIWRATDPKQGDIKMFSDKVNKEVENNYIEILRIGF